MISVSSGRFSDWMRVRVEMFFPVGSEKAGIRRAFS
jgi:hypothetical protein